MAAPRPSRIAGYLLLALLAAGSVKRQYLRFLAPDLRGATNYFTRLPDEQTPGYPPFLEAVRERTRPGDSIAIVVPYRHWDRGYCYAYYRASYFLTGRRVIPLVDDADRTHMDRLRHAEYIADWRAGLPFDGFEVVWSGREGRLLRRIAG